MEGIVWITGANGLIGNYLIQTAPRMAPRWEVIGLTRARLDVTDANAVREQFRARGPQLIIHCAALSRSPACQENPSLARKVNVEATACLAGLAHAIPFVFLSSDLVFDGQQGNYDESARPNPLSVYAETKLEAEQVVMVNPKHTVVRLSLNGGASPSGDRAFNEEMRRAWQEGKMLKLFVDEFRCPIPAIVTARAIWELIAQGKTGLYHLAGSQRLSRWEMGRLIAARSPQLNPRLEPSSRKDYTGPPRPLDTSLNCAKVQRLLSFPLPGLGEWLQANPKEPF
jgi:dTDP-4-dehydrorhamnose reductase